MNVLVVGSGGREHALCWALSHSTTVFCAPGNPGTSSVATNLLLDPNQQHDIVEAVRQHRIDLVVVGPEAPLADGLVDALTAQDIRAFGPTAAAARIEASKAYAKKVMAAADVPTAASATFTDERAALAYVAQHDEPLVVKASGLAAGKGAVVCDTRAEADRTVRAMFGGQFGAAGDEIVVEAFLKGEELSVFAVTDGERTMLLPSAQDHKRLEEGDHGPNTGGMGAYTPVSIASPTLLQRVEREVLEPVLHHMAATGAPFRGVLYAGLMIDDRGNPSVVEFNCRLGDPEAQAILPAADVDLADHLWRIAAGEPWRPPARIEAGRAAVTTVVAAPGYPSAPEKGTAITVPEDLPSHMLLFHAGTKTDADGTLRSNGGRVLSATGLGATVAEAATRSRALAELVAFERAVFRRDIGWREVARAGAP